MKMVSHQRETLGKTCSSVLLSLFVPAVAVGGGAGGGVAVSAVSFSAKQVFSDVSEGMREHTCVILTGSGGEKWSDLTRLITKEKYSSCLINLGSRFTVRVRVRVSKSKIVFIF